MSSTSPVSPPPKRKRFPLGEELYAQLECGADMDLTFFVGKSKFPAHRSEFFRVLQFLKVHVKL